MFYLSHNKFSNHRSVIRQHLLNATLGQKSTISGTIVTLAVFFTLWIVIMDCVSKDTPHSGDLLFCVQQDSDMEKAIGSSTGEYTHVAILEVDNNGRIWIIEATSGVGVHRIPFRHWKKDNGIFRVYRLSIPFDTAAVIARAKSFIGQPYDDSFLPDNGSLYCSELVYEAFLDSSGKHLFENQPMNFRDKNGKMPRYWKRHFRKLGIPIPEGVPGTNPTDMAKSKLLNQVL